MGKSRPIGPETGRGDPASDQSLGTLGGVALVLVRTRQGRWAAAPNGGARIRVNSINPGMIETKGFHAAGLAESDFRKQVETQTPTRTLSLFSCHC